MEIKDQMMLTLLLVLGTAQATKQEPGVSDGYQKPKFCGQADCPKYEVVKKYDKFEHRAYEATRWVKTPLERDFFGLGMMKSFRRLFKYITGSNAEEMKINMTVPVAMYVPLTKPPAGNSTMAFFVPHDVEDPPQPTDPDVYLENAPAMSAYVRSFGGYALDPTYSKEAVVLAEELRSLGYEFYDSFYLRCGYNDPFTFFDRHNEVWFIAK
ncbi:PREDICTED: heme-binding protein 2-like [Nanorana parkeri]|uniref:heme-binding protein 2-like n=1 Tax=Nanorana parkeri TaxID=125878 RepID=UPI000854D51B|nr:PREDICTED: heme-binding protein 2-like [Nanorana parkeri]